MTVLTLQIPGRLRELGVLIDGSPGEDGGLLLQIFTKEVIGPIFFEIIQRKGDEGSGVETKVP